MRSLGSWGRYTPAVRREKGLLGANGLPLRANCLVRPDATKSPPLALLSHLPPSSEAVISVYAPLLSAHPFFLIFFTESTMNRMEALCGLGCKAVAVAALLLWSAAGAAQLLGGSTITNTTNTLSSTAGTLSTGGSQAMASRAVVMGIVTSLVDTGTLTSASEPLASGLPAGNIPGLLTAESLHATTMGWSDQVASEASLSNLALSVAGIGISAEFIQSRALAASGAVPTGLTSIEGLSIDGVPVSVGAAPNQSISLPG